MKINYRISSSKAKDAICKGIDPSALYSFEYDLNSISESDRSLISKAWSSNSEIMLNVCPASLDADAFLSALRVVVANREEADSQRRVDLEEQRRGAIQHLKKVIKEVLEMPFDLLLTSPTKYDSDLYGRNHPAGDELPGYAEARRKVEEAKTINKQLREEAQEKEQQRQDKLLAEFIESYGSKLLKLRVEEGFNYIKLASTEYCHKVLTDLGVKLENVVHDQDASIDEYIEYNNPQLEDIELYQHYKSLVKEKELNVIVTIVLVSISSDDYYSDNDKKKAMSFEIKPPWTRKSYTFFLYI
jgi:hypothetical protein